MRKKQNNSAVLISDVHFNINTLPVASKALTKAVELSNDLQVPLIVCGDLHDTKANLRGECVKAMLDILNLKNDQVTIVLAGNHDKINEKSDQDSLEFLRGTAIVIRQLTCFRNFALMPYYHNPDEYVKTIEKIPKDKVIFCHQGVTGALPGEYTMDKSAVNKDKLAGRRIISGHYHTRQTIELPDGGSWSYVGNPYTLNFAEAKDPEKGIQILKNDGTLEFVPLNLRRHHSVDINVEDLNSLAQVPVGPEDIIRLRISGTNDKLSKVTRKNLEKLITAGVFKIEFIRTDKPTKIPTKTANLINDIIDSMDNIDKNRKEKLKTMWETMK